MTAQRTQFFFWINILLLALVLVGFAPTFYAVPTEVVSEFPTTLIIHGVVLSLWFVWLGMQVSLVRLGRTAQHRVMGKIGAVIGAATIFAGPLATLGSVSRLKAKGLDWDSNMSDYPALGIESWTFDEFARMLVFGNFSSALVFAVLFVAAVVLRSKPFEHKRLMTFASLAMIAPALARISRWPYMGGEDGPVIPLVLIALLLSVVIHDKVMLGKVPRVTWVCLATTILIQAIAMAISTTDIAGDWVHALA